MTPQTTPTPTQTSTPTPDACVAALVRLAKQDATLSVSLTGRINDKSYHSSPYAPYAFVSVATEAHISQVLSICHSFSIPVIPVAGRTSLEGHILPTKERGVILDTSSMDAIVALHVKDLDVVVEPGVGWTDLREYLKPHGLFFPPDPGASACIGGMCGTNCSGTLAFRYGTMKDNILNLRVVLADGTIIQTRKRAVKSSAGYDLTRLFVGSEGTLGIVSQATLRLRRLPTHTTVALAQFHTLESSATVVSALVESGIPFLRLEILDDVCIKACNNDISDPSKRFKELTTLLVECAGSSLETMKDQLMQFKRICHGVAASVTLAESPEEANRLWSIRKRAFFAAPSLREGEPTRVVVTDVAVPISRLVDILHYTKESLQKLNLLGPIVAHAGDGNFHCLLLVKDGDEDELVRAETFRNDMAMKALEMDGTCTGEHGVGSGKMHLLEKELGPEAIQLMKKIKNVMDPHKILNPGKIFKDLNIENKVPQSSKL